MTAATLCSGIGAPEVAMPWVNWKWSAEIEVFPSAVLRRYRPAVPNLGNITASDFIDRAMELGPLDLMVAGTPCQGFSVAGLRKSLGDERGNLTLRFVGIINALQPGTVLWENVPGVLNTRDNAFGCFLGALVGADSALEPVPYANGSRWWRTSRRPKRWRHRFDGGWDVVRWTERYWPVWPDAGLVVGPTRSAAWRVLDAQYFGLAQRRERVFVVASSGAVSPAEILFERDGLQRYFAPSRETREDVTGTISARTQGGGGLGTDFEIGGGLSRTLRGQSNASHRADTDTYVPVMSMCLNGGGQRRIDAESETFVTHALRADGFDASEDGTGRGTPLVPVVCPTLRAGGNSTGGDRPPGKDVDACESLVTVYPILEAGARTGNSTDDPRAGIGIGEPNDPMYTLQSGKQHAIAFDGTQITSKTNRSNPQSGDPCHTLAKGAQPPTIAFSCKDHGADAGEIAPTLRSMGHDASHANAGGQVAVAFRAAGQDGFTPAEMTPPLCSTDGGGTVPTVATLAIRGRGDTSNLEVRTDGTANALLTPNGGRGGIGVGAIHSGMAVRRLTPTECERLQGFPDGHTAIKFRGKDAADGPRYKALGNSMAVPVIAWIGERIRKALER